MPLNKTAHALTWAQESETHPQFIPPPPGKRIEDLEITNVWIALGGPPLHNNRAAGYYRGGSGRNVQLYPKSGTWYDFATGAGGGIIALVMVVQGCGKAEALAWLADNFGVAVRGPQPASARREYARRMVQAKKRAEAIVGRRDAYLEDLRFAGAVLLAEFHRLTREGEENQDIDAIALAENCFELLDKLAERRDRLKVASGPELEMFFVKLEGLAA